MKNIPAFPICEEMILFPIYNDKGELIGNKSSVKNLTGMSLRDYFAAKAMNGELSTSIDFSWKPEVLAERCYKMADAMLAEREKYE